MTGTVVNGGIEQFVERCYSTVLGRTGDAGGMSRNEVLEGFSRSTEFAAILESYGL